MVFCKTDMGTIQAWSYGNKYNGYGNDWEDGLATERGISIGKSDGYAYVHVEQVRGKEKLVLYINKAVCDAEGVEIIIE